MITALPMPIITFLVLASSYNLQFRRAKNIQPIKCTKTNLDNIYNKFNSPNNTTATEVVDKDVNIENLEEKQKR